MEDLPDISAATLAPPPVINPTTTLIWPSLGTSENFFEKALVNGHLPPPPEGAYVNGLDEMVRSDEEKDDWDAENQAEEEAGDWGLDEPEEAEASEPEDQEAGAAATEGVSELDLWVRNSPFAADHVAAGSFETAMQVCQIISSLVTNLSDFNSCSTDSPVLLTLNLSNHYSWEPIGLLMLTSRPMLHYLRCSYIYAVIPKSRRLLACYRLPEH